MALSYLLGLGGTVDYEMEWDGELLTRRLLAEGITQIPASAPREIVDERDLLQAIVFHLSTGSGGEYFVRDDLVIERFVANAAYRVTLGGTGVRAARALDAWGMRSTVHLVSENRYFEQLLPTRVESVSSATQPSVDPHLIIQFAAQDTVTVGDVRLIASRANRIIFTADEPNRMLRLVPDLPEQVAAHDVFLISGLNSIRQRTVLDSRVAELRDACMPDMARPSAARTLVIAEHAAYHVRGFSRVALEQVSVLCDVYGLNEDELSELVGRPVDVRDPGDVIPALHECVEIVAARHVLVHTHAWAAVVGPQAGRYATALRRANITAAARYRWGDEATRDSFEQVGRLPRNEEGSRIAGAIERAFPGAQADPGYVVETRTPTTIGLGDCFVGGFLAGLEESHVPTRP
jgi:ADP-dependent phosphofructokinase/glucokinase